MNAKPIYVTEPHLPPLEEFIPYLEQIWDSRQLTNMGPLHRQLEHALAAALEVPQLSLFSNGTVALIAALKVLGLSGEVITTPYSFVATAHSLLWNNLKPVFVDIDPATFNLDPARIEAAVTPRTCAILPVHCYGYPCDVEAIDAIARRHGLKVVYDAAHAFGVTLNGQGILNHGDLAVMSFHATKVFNTLEGGAIACRDAATRAGVERMRNFGFVDEVTIEGVGLNGKMNEVQAALGLLQLKHLDPAMRRRREIDRQYRRGLAGARGISCPREPAGAVGNCGYFPILVGPDHPRGREGLYQHLRTHGIFARRYFYPLLSTLAPYRDLPSSSAKHLPHATAAAERVLCLPIHPRLDDADVARIVELVA